jgi:hypothetical protein
MPPPGPAGIDDALLPAAALDADRTSSASPGALPVSPPEAPAHRSASGLAWAAGIATLFTFVMARSKLPASAPSAQEKPRPGRSFFFWMAPLLLILGPWATTCWGQPRPALLYALPEAGTWVEYTIQWRDSRGEFNGTMRLRNLGQRDKSPGRTWIEARKTWKEDGKSSVHLRKVAIPTDAFEPGRTLEALALLDNPPQKGSKGPLDLGKARDFLFLGFNKDVSIAWADRNLEFTCGLGVLPARLGTARGRVKGRPLEYRVWRSSRVPFGWAQFEVRAPPGTLLFRATAQKTGLGALNEQEDKELPRPTRSKRMSRASCMPISDFYFTRNRSTSVVTLLEKEEGERFLIEVCGLGTEDHREYVNVFIWQFHRI